MFLDGKFNGVVLTLFSLDLAKPKCVLGIFEHLISDDKSVLQECSVINVFQLGSGSLSVIVASWQQNALGTLYICISYPILTFPTSHIFIAYHLTSYAIA